MQLQHINFLILYSLLLYKLYLVLESLLVGIVSLAGRGGIYVFGDVIAAHELLLCSQARYEFIHDAYALSTCIEHSSTGCLLNIVFFLKML